MDNKGLLFIPDISGFSRFVSETEIEHSTLIIQELLEILINANQIGLEVSEIEGDAILFYKFGERPALEELYKQVEKMFCEFHRNLFSYEHRRFCQCKACISAIDLTLKVITHYGEFTNYNVKNFHKLIGKDLIVAHQLLKNDIKQHEYWLVTDNLVTEKKPADFAKWMQWNTSAKQTEAGELPFCYTQLGELKNEISPEPPVQLDLTKKIKSISISSEYDTDIITLLHATGDFRYRNQWQPGVVKVEELQHFLPRVGMRCRFILENGEAISYSSSYFFQPERIEFSETDEKTQNTTYYTLEQISIKRTRLTLDFYTKKNFISETLFRLKEKNKKESTFKQSLDNLVGLVKELKIPTALK